MPPDSIVDGAIIDGAAVADAIRRLFEHKALQDQGRRRLAVGQRGHRQEDQPAGDDRGGAVRVDLLGGRAVHPLRHPGRQPRLPDPRPRHRAPTRRARWTCCWWRPRRTRSPTTPASSRRPAACRSSSTSTPSPCRTPTRPTTASTPDAVVVLLNAGASAININILSGDQSVFTRDISIGGNAYTEAVQKELNLPFESAEQLKKGEPVDGVDLRGRAAGAARDDRERAARDSEDLRLLQGDRGLRSHRSHHAERRRVARRRLRARARGALRRAGRSCSIRSGRSRSTPAKLGVARSPSDVAPTAAVAVGLALRKAGDR